MTVAGAGAGNSAFNANAAVENWNVNYAATITLQAVGQDVTGADATSQTVKSAAAVDALAVNQVSDGCHGFDSN